MENDRQELKADEVTHEKPFAFCCAEAGGDPDACDCVNKNHGTAKFEASCIMVNCRNRAPAGEAFCAKHREGRPIPDTPITLHQQLIGTIETLLTKHEAYHNSIEHAAARQLLRTIRGEA